MTSTSPIEAAGTVATGPCAGCTSPDPRGCKYWRRHPRGCALVMGAEGPAVAEQYRRRVAGLPPEPREPRPRLGPPRPPAGPLAYDPPPGDRVAIESFANPTSGFGRLVEWTGRALELADVPAAFDLSSGVDLRDGLPVSPWMEARLAPGAPDPWRLFFQYMGAPAPPGRRSVYFTLHDSDAPPAGLVAAVNPARMVLVPSSWNAATFREAGVEPPIRVVPAGIPDGHWRPRPARAGSGLPFRALFSARLLGGGVRKGHREAIEAFRLAFPIGEFPDAELVLKVFDECVAILGEIPSDPRIRVDVRALTDAQLAEYYRDFDLLLAPTKAESIGLITLEAMRSGLPPAIALETGTRDYVHPAAAYALAGRWAPARSYYEGMGRWFEPDVGSIAAALRRAYGDRSECDARGRIAAEWSGRFTLERMGRELRAALVEAGMLAADGARAKAASAGRPPRVGRADPPHARPEPNLPSLGRMAVGLVGSIARHVATGARPADAATVAGRLAACEACDHFRPSDRRCGRETGCGCFVDSKAKLATASCPRGRWPAPAVDPPPAAP